MFYWLCNQISRNDENFTDLFLPLMGISFAELDNLTVSYGNFTLFTSNDELLVLGSFAIHFWLVNVYEWFYAWLAIWILCFLRKVQEISEQLTTCKSWQTVCSGHYFMVAHRLVQSSEYWLDFSNGGLHLQWFLVGNSENSFCICSTVCKFNFDLKMNSLQECLFNGWE